MLYCLNVGNIICYCIFFQNARPLVLQFSRTHYTYLHAVLLNYDYHNDMQSNSYWS